MSNLAINRSIQLVSLDTHPANNALVVTYEILVTVCEPANGHLLARGNKRHSFQIQLSVLDKLNKPELQAERLAISLTDLSDEIKRKCPILASQSAEEIQLHLLYLLNRRRAQLSELGAQQVAVSSAPATSGRRLGSARVRLLSSRSSASSERSRLVDDFVGEFIKHGDVYSYFRTIELNFKQNREDVKLDIFMKRLDEELLNGEVEVQVSEKSLQLSPEQLENLLEGLYGDQTERLTSIAAIRRLSRNEPHSLLALTSNRLLVCALLRTLRDSQSNHRQLRDSILYCLIRFTTFQDVYARICFDDESHTVNELSRSVLDLLVAQASEKSWPKTQKDADQYYQVVTSLLIIINNIIRCDANCLKLLLLNNHPLAKSNSFVCSLMKLFVWAIRRLTREIQLLDAPEALLYLVKESLKLTQQLSKFREFINELKKWQESNTFWDSINSLLDSIQTSRPSSGMDASLALANKRISCELYELELELVQLLNNLMLDHRLKLQLIRRNFLKIILRSLVVFLASTHSALTFDQSAVLRVPFKSLYELTCNPKARSKIFESKIIMKCLLEYLLAITKANEGVRLSSSSIVQDGELGQLLLEPTCASDYILCLWINFSANPKAPIYNPEDSELSELVGEYLSTSLDNIKLMNSIEFYSQVYLHLKLVRNLTQFSGVNLMNLNKDKNWIESISQAAIHLLVVDYKSPALVEFLGILGNLLISPNSIKRTKPEPELVSLLVDLLNLLQGKHKQQQQINLNTEQDDLLLVSVLAVAGLARSRELCQQFSSHEANEQPELVGRLVEASSSLLSSRPSDSELILSALYALIQLMGHLNFLQEFSGSKFIWELSCGQLASELASLASHADSSISKLSIKILSWLDQLEIERKESDERIKRIRFVAYNAKWMSAIKAAGQQTIQLEAELLGSVGDSASGYWDKGELMALQKEDANSTDDDDELKFTHLRDLNENYGDGAEFCLSNKRQLHSADRIDEQDEQDDEDADEDDERADLNVIDANSMIKHLTSRREFRSLSERKQLSMKQLDR